MSKFDVNVEKCSEQKLASGLNRRESTSFGTLSANCIHVSFDFVDGDSCLVLFGHQMALPQLCFVSCQFIIATA